MLKRSITFTMLLCVVTILLSALSLKSAEAKTTAQSQYSSNACGQWSVVPSPDLNGNGGLSAVAAVSANDVWAVGSNGSQRGSGQTVIEHWNGKQWVVVSSPSPDLYNTLTSVSVVSATDVWAAGWHANGSITQTLIEHWNGTQWSVVKSPSPASINNELYGVTAVSANNVWAVGWIANTGSVEQTLVEHWNGTGWSVVKSPNPGSQISSLSGISAASASDVWAVGYYENSSSLWLALTEHWNGKQWRVVKSSSPGTQINYLFSVTAISANDAWTVGYADQHSLIEHWNGTQWSVVKSPSPGTVSNLLIAVTAISASDIWTVGSFENSNFVSQTLTEHWNGTQWSVVKSPSPGSITTQLSGVTAISSTDVWASGHADSNTLTEHYC